MMNRIIYSANENISITMKNFKSYIEFSKCSKSYDRYLSTGFTHIIPISFSELHKVL